LLKPTCLTPDKYLTGVTDRVTNNFLQKVGFHFTKTKKYGLVATKVSANYLFAKTVICSFFLQQTLPQGRSFFLIEKH
jgi:hypothetical protein